MPRGRRDGTKEEVEGEDRERVGGAGEGWGEVGGAGRGWEGYCGHGTGDTGLYPALGVKGSSVCVTRLSLSLYIYNCP